ncbi:MAG: HEAT repeat domain-containing protein [Actinomycetota bacterium]
MLPSNPPRGWRSDPLFGDALSEFRLLLTGEDRDFVDQLAARLGVHRVLVERSRRRFPPGARLRAVATLVDLATPLQRHHLRSLLTDRSSLVRIHVVRGLARLQDTESIPTILDLAGRAQPWEAARIADSLVTMGPSAVDPIRAWIEHELEHPPPAHHMVALCARVLGLVGDPSAEPVLLRLLASDREEWRVAAASALEDTGGPDSVQPLLEALEDRSWRVRARAAIALGAMAEPAVGRPVSALLYDPVWWVRQNSAAALARIPGGERHLLAALSGPDPYASDAALNQLTVSGALASAVDRVRSGTGSEIDHQLAALATASA